MSLSLFLSLWEKKRQSGDHEKRQNNRAPKYTVNIREGANKAEKQRAYGLRQGIGKAVDCHEAASVLGRGKARERPVKIGKNQALSQAPYVEDRPGPVYALRKRGKKHDRHKETESYLNKAN